MSFDKNELKSKAFLERISSLTSDYENRIADLRVELTIAVSQKEAAENELAEEKARAADTSEKPSY